MRLGAVHICSYFGIVQLQLSLTILRELSLLVGQEKQNLTLSLIQTSSIQIKEYSACVCDSCAPRPPVH